MLPLALGLSASLCWGLADFSGGVETRRLPAPIVVLVGQFLPVSQYSGSCWPLEPVLFRPVAAWSRRVLPELLEPSESQLFYRALSIGTISVVAPIAATGAIVPVAFGLFGGERPS